MICPSSFTRQRDHIDHMRFQGPAEVRGGGRERAHLCPCPVSSSTKASLASFQGCGCGHTMAQPPQLLWGWCVNAPPLLRQPCFGSWKHGTALTAASAPERKGAPPTSNWEHLEIAKAFRVQVFLIQLWHAAVADYLAIWHFPLQGGAEDSFMKQIPRNISRYQGLLVS